MSTTRDDLQRRYPAIVAVIEGGVFSIGTVRESAAIELAELVAELDALRAAITNALPAIESLCGPLPPSSEGDEIRALRRAVER